MNKGSRMAIEGVCIQLDAQGPYGHTTKVGATLN
jgi:hypothetical protein